jgi:hypothetical protein
VGIAIGATSKGRSASSSSQGTLGVSTSASGSTFVVAAIWDTGTFSSITDSKSNVYTQIGTEVTFGSFPTRARVYYKENGVGGASHIATFNTSSASAITVLFLEITGALTSGSLDQSGGVNDASSPFTLTAGLTTAQAAEALVTFLGCNSGSNPATHAETGLGSSTIQTAAEETDGTSFYTAALATAIKAATAAFNPSWTESGGTNSAVFLATFKEAATDILMGQVIL